MGSLALVMVSYPWFACFRDKGKGSGEEGPFINFLGRDAALIKKCEVPTPDGQTSKDLVNRVAPGTLGAGLNPLG